MKIDTRKLGKFVTEKGYRRYVPNPINQPFTFSNPKITVLLEEATRGIGELNVASSQVPDIDFFIEMHVVKEATDSSQIEGTKTTIDEAVMPEEEIVPERRDDWAEVQNYITAMDYAIEKLQSGMPLSMRLLNDVHKRLLAGVRGREKNPGEIRKRQNWIGGNTPPDAHFVPPAEHELPNLISDLEKFWHNEKIQVPQLIRAGLSHYQFETLHPFLDGNGRIGRLLITLYLIEKGMLDRQTLYLSDFFRRNKIAYYDSLDAPRFKDDQDAWIIFFLESVSMTTRKSADTLKKISELRTDCMERILRLGRRGETASQLLNRLFSKPSIRVNDLKEEMKISYPAANKLVADFEKLKILHEYTGTKRNRAFIFREYVSLFR